MIPHRLCLRLMPVNESQVSVGMNVKPKRKSIAGKIKYKTQEQLRSETTTIFHSGEWFRVRIQGLLIMEDDKENPSDCDLKVGMYTILQWCSVFVQHQTQPEIAVKKKFRRMDRNGCEIEVPDFESYCTANWHTASIPGALYCRFGPFSWHKSILDIQFFDFGDQGCQFHCLTLLRESSKDEVFQ